MATFTTIVKNALSWTAPPVVPGQEYLLEIGGDFLLDIGGYSLIINPGGRNETPWTRVNKTR